MAVLLETINSVERQHQLDTQRSQSTFCAAVDAETNHAFSAFSFDILPQPQTGYPAGITECSSMPHNNAETCRWCDQRSASPASSSQSASDRWHDAFSDIASATCSSSVPDCSAFIQEGTLEWRITQLRSIREECSAPFVSRKRIFTSMWLIAASQWSYHSCTLQNDSGAIQTECSQHAAWSQQMLPPGESKQLHSPCLPQATIQIRHVTNCART
jgi:hypothetical protein